MRHLWREPAARHRALHMYDQPNSFETYLKSSSTDSPFQKCKRHRKELQNCETSSQQAAWDRALRLTIKSVASKIAHKSTDIVKKRLLQKKSLKNTATTSTSQTGIWQPAPVPLWNPNSKSAGKKESSWFKTTPRKDEKKKRRSNNSLPSTSAKRSCVEKTKRVKVEYDYDV